MRKSEAEGLVAYLASAYRTQLEPTSVAVYVEHLLPFELEDAQYAAKFAVSESKFFPSVAELSEWATERCLIRAQAVEDERLRREWSEHRMLTAEEILAEPERVGMPPELKERVHAMFREPDDLDDRVEDTKRCREALHALATIHPSNRLVPVTVGRVSKPEYQQNGPKCAVCGARTWQDGGRYWFCGADGWLKAK